MPKILEAELFKQSSCDSCSEHDILGFQKDLINSIKRQTL